MKTDQEKDEYQFGAFKNREYPGTHFNLLITLTVDPPMMVYRWYDKTDNMLNKKGRQILEATGINTTGQFCEPTWTCYKKFKTLEEFKEWFREEYFEWLL